MKVNIQFLSFGCRKTQCPFWERGIPGCYLIPYFFELGDRDREHDCWDFEKVTNGSIEIKDKKGETLLAVII